MESLGARLRALRSGAGRTVASVATEAGLSVPYIANLENGRGNPTLAALDRLVRALGATLTVDLGSTSAPEAALPPAALVRLARTDRFRRLAVELGAAGADPSATAAALVDLLARVGSAIGVEPDEHDYWRLLDALTLIKRHPAGWRSP